MAVDTVFHTSRGLGSTKPRVGPLIEHKAHLAEQQCLSRDGAHPSEGIAKETSLDRAYDLSGANSQEVCGCVFSIFATRVIRAKAGSRTDVGYRKTCESV